MYRLYRQFLLNAADLFSIRHFVLECAAAGCCVVDAAHVIASISGARKLLQSLLLPASETRGLGTFQAAKAKNAIVVSAQLSATSN